MNTIIHNRKIRPSGRLKSSSYKIDTQRVTKDDTLIVNIDHESNGFSARYYFKGTDIARRKSIHFTVAGTEQIDIKWSGAQPSLIPEPTIITLQPTWFKMGYYVYVVEMKYKNARYFYVGMTGDRKHKTARSPFYRMGGHFSQVTSSTQNQIIKGIKKYIDSETPLEKLLCTIEFTYYSYCMTEFDKMVDNAVHASRRLSTEQVESNLIEKMKAEFGKDYIFNARGSVKVTDKMNAVATELLNDIKRRTKTK